jgi:diguanylate cyclase (GGDEF)-like protein
MAELGFPVWHPASSGTDLTDPEAVSLVGSSHDTWPPEFAAHPRGAAVMLTAALVSFPAAAVLVEQRGSSWRVWPTAPLAPSIGEYGKEGWLDEADLARLLESLGVTGEIRLRARRERGDARWQHANRDWRLISANGVTFLFQSLESAELQIQAPAAHSVYRLPMAQELVVGVMRRDPRWLSDLIEADPTLLPAEAAMLDIVERMPYRLLLEASPDHDVDNATTVLASALRMDRRMGQRRFLTQAEAQLTPRSDNELNLLCRALSDTFTAADEIGVYSDVATVLGFSMRVQWTTQQLAAGLCATWSFPQRANDADWTDEAGKLGFHFASVRRVDGDLQVTAASPTAQQSGFLPMDRTQACARFWSQVDQHLESIPAGDQIEFIALFGIDRHRVVAQAAKDETWSLAWRRDTTPSSSDVQPQSDCRVSIDHGGRVLGFTSGFYRLVGSVSIGAPLADVVPEAMADLIGELIRAAITHSVVEQALPWDRPRYRRWLRARVTRTVHESGESVFEATFDTLTAGSRGPRGEFSPLIHDSLTGVYNRHALDALLALGHEATAEFDGAVYLDVAGFKQINDTYGHHVGDQCLQVVATWLAHECLPGDLIGRPSGDEFVLLCSDVVRMVDRLRAWGWRAGQVDDLTIPLGIRLGWSRRDPAMTLAQVARRADVALTAAKTSGLGAVVPYSDSLRDRQRAFVTAQGELREAMASPHGIRCAFQPLVEVTTGKIIGFESLIRGFAHGHHLSADVLLDAARQVGIITQVLERGFSQALLEGRRLLDAFPHVDLWLNVDRVQFASDGGLDALMSEIEHRDLPTHRIVIEVTEQTLNDLDEREFAASLNRARSRGARIAIDDFGQGASNLAAVAQLPIDIVKVDRSLVPHSADDPGWRLVSAVTELGRAFGRKVVVEGIETPVQARKCAELGIVVQQGFLHGRPRSAQNILSRGATPPRPWMLR